MALYIAADSYEILGEAQSIKKHAAAAVKVVKKRSRELWSIF